jgi:hypothetical protein
MQFPFSGILPVYAISSDVATPWVHRAPDAVFFFWAATRAASEEQEAFLAGCTPL